MDKELRYRLFGLGAIARRLHRNLGLLEYISYGLHQQPFGLHNNFALYWIWGSIMGTQILDLYKITASDEKFSFAKIINIAKDLKVDVNYAPLEDGVKSLKEMYDDTELEKVRSKYLAHQDLRVPEIATDLRTLRALTEEVIDLLNLFLDTFGRKRLVFSNDVADSFKKIFDVIDEYEEVKAFLLAERINGKDSVKISRIAQIVKERERDA